mgnify:CR=1 FL=1
MMPILWLTAPPKVFKTIDIREFSPLVSWSTTILMCRNDEKTMKIMAQGELKEYMYAYNVPPGTQVLLGTTVFPFNKIERKFYKSFKAYVHFKMFSGADWIIIHDIPILDEDSLEIELKKIRKNLEIVKYYLHIRDETNADVKLIAIPQSTSINTIAKLARTYETYGVDAIGISLATINNRGIPYRDKNKKKMILEMIKRIRVNTTIPIIVLGSQEPNLARELYIRYGIKTFEGSLLVRKSFPEARKPPLRLIIENNKAKFIPTFVGKEFSPANNLKSNVKTWIEFVKKAL